MATALWIILIGLWIGWCAQAILSVLLVRKFTRRLLRKPRDFRHPYHPKAVVIVPFKGIEPGIEQHIQRLTSQDYPDYRLVFVVQSEDDPAHALLQEAAGRLTREVNIIVAGDAGPNVGQKVHNQRRALQFIEQQQWGEAVWVFADSDAAPGELWLARLIGPLNKPHNGVTTGYRWLIPQADPQGRVRFGSHMASIINSSVACFLGREQFNHAWGGSMAIRVADARAGGLMDRLDGALTDDYPMSQLCRALGKDVVFVFESLVWSPVQFDLAGLVNFAHRQYLLTRVYEPGLYRHALWITWLYPLGFFTAVAMFLRGLWRGPDMAAWMLPLGAMLIVHAADQMRAGYRRRTIERAFGGEALRQLRTTLRLDRFATPLWMSLHALLAARAAFGNTMTWRNIRYRIRGPQDVERLS